MNIGARTATWNNGGTEVMDIYVSTICFYGNSTQNPMSGEYDLNFIHLIGCTSLNRCFAECTNISKLDISDWDFSELTNANELFKNLGASVSDFELIMPTYAPVIGNISMAFRMPKLKTLDLSGWDFSNVSSVGWGPFDGNVALENLTLKAQTFKVSLNFSTCTALSTASATSICNSCATVSASKTMTLPASKQTVYEADATFVAARDAAVSRGWTIAFA